MVMSFRDIRNFTEMMRALGYTRLISMENFRTPNFHLVAEILKWLIKRYDANEDIPFDIDTEQDRVIFIKNVAQFLATRAHLKLNTKRLYQADGYAVKEMLKVTTMLYEAMQGKNNSDDNSEHNIYATLDMAKINDIKESRKLAPEITSCGASFCDLLQKEVMLREARNLSIARQVDHAQVERGIKASIKQVELECKQTLQQLENIASDEANLDAKIEKKRSELERNQKRLAALSSVRPAYMDDYERMESDLHKLYRIYLTKFRNLAYLEAQYEEFCKTEQERHEESGLTLKKMADSLRHQENGAFAKSTLDDDDNLEGLVDEDDEALESSEQDSFHKPTGGGARAMNNKIAASNGDKSHQRYPHNDAVGHELELDDDDDDVDDEDDDDDENDDNDDDDEDDMASGLDDSDMDVGGPDGDNDRRRADMAMVNRARMQHARGAAHGARAANDQVSPRGAAGKRPGGKGRAAAVVQDDDDF